MICHHTRRTVFSTLLPECDAVASQTAKGRFIDAATDLRRDLVRRRRSAANSSEPSSSARIGLCETAPSLFAQLPLAESSSLKDLTSRLITRDDHLLLESVATSRERGP